MKSYESATVQELCHTYSPANSTSADGWAIQVISNPIPSESIDQDSYQSAAPTSSRLISLGEIIPDPKSFDFDSIKVNYYFLSPIFAYLPSGFFLPRAPPGNLSLIA